VAKIELEVGTCPTGVLLALKSVEGRVHHVTAIEMTNDEALEISKLIKQRYSRPERFFNRSHFFNDEDRKILITCLCW